MNFWNISLVIIAWIVIVVGIVGIFLPFLPGTFLIFIGGVILALITENFSWLPVILLAVFWLISQTLDFLSSSWGAKHFGATKYGVWLAPTGAIIGLIFGGIVGMIFGGIVLTILGEYLLAKKDFKKAAKSGFGVLFGIIISQILGIVIAITMIGLIIHFFI